MTERVLADAEIEATIRRFMMKGWNDSVGFARAVEAAVLEKTRGTFYTTAYWSAGQSMVPERDARKRERAAWDAAMEVAKHSYFVVPAYGERDIRYPLPTKRVPRTVTLSDGLMVSATGVSIGPAFYYTRREFGGSGGAGSAMNPLVLAKTPADARLLADLVERPYDEVPEP